ncbi:hypothetical protein [Alkalihalobacillus sp. LMS39]|uniref:hypothetical protein n=1 Tax=Alkalihalobacillus sp. LMS39 TaxID=2924032 RepID=UPI001FB4719C|nr:hypothetical protein [Alkalihalobacillus sp. LMS39]UOE95340.1 hypothetical protein MM271_06900 [Alkalihalobacillus sp. LMS39]
MRNKTLLAITSSLLIIGCSQSPSDRVEDAMKQAISQESTEKNDHVILLEDERSLEAIIYDLDEYYNDYDLAGWNSVNHPDGYRFYDQQFMDTIKQAKVQRRTVFVDTLLTKDGIAVVLCKFEFRQDKEYDINDNWNSNFTTMVVFVEYNNEWKKYDSWTLREAWLLEDGTENPLSTNNYKEMDQLELIEKIKNENLNPLQTFYDFHSEKAVTEEEAADIKQLFEQADEAFNSRDVNGWNSTRHPNLTPVDHDFMEEREQVNVKRDTTFIEPLYSNGATAIVHVTYEFRQEQEFDSSNNWNKNNSSLAILQKYKDQWKINHHFTLHDSWLLENGSPDPESTYDYNKAEQLKLVESIKQDWLHPVDTLQKYHDEHFQ